MLGYDLAFYSMPCQYKRILVAAGITRDLRVCYVRRRVSLHKSCQSHPSSLSIDLNPIVIPMQLLVSSHTDKAYYRMQGHNQEFSLLPSQSILALKAWVRTYNQLLLGSFKLVFSVMFSFIKQLTMSYPSSHLGPQPPLQATSRYYIQITYPKLMNHKSNNHSKITSVLYK